jgi:hypothetical protein
LVILFLSQHEFLVSAACATGSSGSFKSIESFRISPSSGVLNARLARFRIEGILDQLACPQQEFCGVRYNLSPNLDNSSKLGYSSKTSGTLRSLGGSTVEESQSSACALA